MRAKVRMPTEKEEAAIQRGIAEDSDNPERGAEFFTRAQPADQVLPAEVLAGLVRRRGPGKRPAKVAVTLKLAPDVLAALRASGVGWQARAEVALRAMVELAPVQPGPRKPMPGKR